MTKKLRAYQREGVEFLKRRRSALLSDQQGLGKTIQTIVACKEANDTRILIVAPKNMLSTWANEIADWDAEAESVILIGTRVQKINALRDNWPDSSGNRTYFITNWETLLQKDMPTANLPWDRVVADEAHRIKNRKAKRTKALKKIRTLKKTALTGTAFDSRPDELWSVLNWLDPKRWSSYWAFYNKYLEWDDTPWGRKVSGLKSNGIPLKTDIQPWVLRRLKSQVLTELPPKQYQYIWCDLSKTQYEMYQQLTKEFLAEFDGITVDAFGILSRMTRFRQLVVSPAVLSDEFPDDSPRLDAVAEYILDLDEPVVVFSNFVDSLWLLADRLGERTTYMYTGDTPHAERNRFLAEFQSERNDNSVFLATIGAGGVGITLHKSSTVVFIDRDYSPANNEQAEDRVHRMGQRDAVNVVIFAVPGTIDTHIMKLLDKKHETFSKVFAADVIGKPPVPKSIFKKRLKETSASSSTK